MKNFARVLALVLVAVMLCTVLIACAGKPAEDPKDAKSALKDAGYDVTLMDEEATLSFLGFDGLEAYLVAYKSDPDQSDYDEDEMEELDGETVQMDYIVIYYFEDEEAAEEAFEDLEDELNEDMEDMVDMMAEMSEEMADEYDIEVEFEFKPKDAKLDGCMIYVGTSDALKNAA